VEGYILECRLKQFGNLSLSKPQGLIVKTALDAGTPVFGLVEDEFGLGQGLVAHIISPNRGAFLLSGVDLSKENG
jgi:hypothetical protein